MKTMKTTIWLKILLKAALIMYVGLFALFSFSQETHEEELGTWLVVFGKSRLTESIDFVTELRWQNYQVFNDLDNAFIRTGLNYNVVPNLAITVGYIHQFSHTLDAHSVSENRLYEEITLKNNIKNIRVAHRYRIEHRWINRQGETQLSHRFRYRIQCTKALSEKFYVRVFDELFINLKKPSFNQNRLHFGLGYQLNPSLQLEVGYLKNHFSEIDYDRIRFGFNFKTNFVKKPNAQ